jgi:hypothetical protein
MEKKVLFSINKKKKKKMITILRVVSGLNNTKRVTYIKVDSSTTVEQACQQAIKAFGFPNDSNNNCHYNYSLVIETGRARIRSPDSPSGIVCLNQGQYSMVLEPNWKLLQYIVPEGDNNNNSSAARKKSIGTENDDDVDHDEIVPSSTQRQRLVVTSSSSTSKTERRRFSLAPWSVVAHLVEGSEQSSTSSAILKYSKIDASAAPKLPDGTLFEQMLIDCKSQQQQQNSTSSVEVGSLHHLPERLQNFTNSLKPCAYTE